MVFDPRSSVISTPHGEDIPNFAASPTISSVADGAWSDPAVWDTGSIPGPGDIVAIAHNVELSGQGQAAVVGVEPSGQ